MVIELSGALFPVLNSFVGTLGEEMLFDFLKGGRLKVIPDLAFLRKLLL